MQFRDRYGKLVDTNKEEVICPWCQSPITKEEIDSEKVTLDKLHGSQIKEDCHMLYHTECLNEEKELDRHMDYVSGYRR